MSKTPSVPSYRLHKQSGQAVVTLPDGLGNRRDVLLGEHGTVESRMEYARVITEWEAAGRRLPQPVSVVADLTVNEMLVAYVLFAEGYYRKNGEPTSQLDRVKHSLKPVRELYGMMPARSFGPLALKAVRERMVQNGWTRGYVNSSVGCVKRAFKWAIENELIPGAVLHGLQAVGGLKKGRTNAKETEKIRPVADELVEGVLPQLTPPVRAMVQVQRLTGMRPCEVVLMRPCDIYQRPQGAWVYRPQTHKTEHHEITRAVFLGPQAQAVLKPFLERDPLAYCFSPREAVEGYMKRHGRKIRHGKKRTPGSRYLVTSYEHAIACACRRAFPHPALLEISGRPIPPKEKAKVRREWIEAHQDELRAWRRAHHWAPNQLRHTKATEIRREAGLDAARAVLGHTSPAITEHYAELDADKAAAVMERLG